MTQKKAFLNGLLRKKCTKVHSTLLDCAQFNNVAAECLHCTQFTIHYYCTFVSLLLLLKIVVADFFFASLQELVLLASRLASLSRRLY